MLALFLLGIAVIAVLSPDTSEILRQQHALRDFARDNRLLACCGFFLMSVVLVGFSVPVGAGMTVLAGFLLGRWTGTVVYSFGSTLGAFLAYSLARVILADAVLRSAESRPGFRVMLRMLDRGFHHRGAYYLLLVRLSPAVPFFVLNLLLGASVRVRFRTFWWTTQVGMLPVTFLWANLGASVAEIRSVRDLVSPEVTAALMLLLVAPAVVHLLAGRYFPAGELAQAAGSSSRKQAPTPPSAGR